MTPAPVIDKFGPAGHNQNSAAVSKFVEPTFVEPADLPENSEDPSAVLGKYQWGNALGEQFNDFFGVLTSHPNWRMPYKLPTPFTSARFFIKGMTDPGSQFKAYWTGRKKFKDLRRSDFFNVVISSLGFIILLAWITQLGLRVAQLWDLVDLNASSAFSWFTFCTSLVGVGLCVVRGLDLLNYAWAAWQEDAEVKDYKKNFKRADLRYGFIKMSQWEPAQLKEVLTMHQLKGCYISTNGKHFYARLQVVQEAGTAKYETVFEEITGEKALSALGKFEVVTANLSGPNILSEKGLAYLQAETGEGPASNAWLECLVWGVVLMIIAVILVGFYCFKATIETLHPLAGLILNITLNEMSSIPLVLDVILQLCIAIDNQEISRLFKKSEDGGFTPKVWWDKVLKWAFLSVKCVAAIGISILFCFPTIHFTSFALGCTGLLTNVVYQACRPLLSWFFPTPDVNLKNDFSLNECDEKKSFEECVETATVSSSNLKTTQPKTVLSPTRIGLSQRLGSSTLVSDDSSAASLKSFGSGSSSGHYSSDEESVSTYSPPPPPSTLLYDIARDKERALAALQDDINLLETERSPEVWEKSPKGVRPTPTLS